MTPELIATLLVLLVPAALILGMLLAGGMVVASLATTDEALIRPVSR